MILLLDNYDSFTYNLVDYFEQLGAQCKVFRNDHIFEEIVSGEYTGLVISPGPQTPSSSGHLMEVIKFYEGKIPILGICLGHQAIGEYYGGSLQKASKPMHGKISKVSLKKDILFKTLPETINVVRYNSLIIKNLPDDIKSIGHSESGEIMALKHNYLPIWGVQFHPEAALTEYGLKILKNWLVYNDITH